MGEGKETRSESQGGFQVRRGKRGDRWKIGKAMVYDRLSVIVQLFRFLMRMEKDECFV